MRMTETRHPPGELGNGVIPTLTGVTRHDYADALLRPGQRHASTQRVRHANRARNVTGASQQR